MKHNGPISRALRAHNGILSRLIAFRDAIRAANDANKEHVAARMHGERPRRLSLAQYRALWWLTRSVGDRGKLGSRWNCEIVRVEHGRDCFCSPDEFDRCQCESWTRYHHVDDFRGYEDTIIALRIGLPRSPEVHGYYDLAVTPYCRVPWPWVGRAAQLDADRLDDRLRRIDARARRIDARARKGAKPCGASPRPH